MGDAKIHVAAANNSKLNLGCQITLSEPRSFTYFINAVAFSIVDVQSAKLFLGPSQLLSVAILGMQLYTCPHRDSPGSQRGNCEGLQSAIPKMGPGCLSRFAAVFEAGPSSNIPPILQYTEGAQVP
jgi:hypothetical protein